MDNDCAVCCHLKEAQEQLAQIAGLIEFSCSAQKKKKDFGLDKGYVMKEVAVIQQMMKYHQYFHSTGESLNDSESVIDLYMNEPQKPKRFREPK